MLFVARLEIPANTAKLNYSRILIPACEGTVVRVVVRWRWGSGSLCGCRVRYSEYQVWPRSKAQWFVSSVHEYNFEELLEITDHPHFFALEAYNLDDTFPHTVEVAINILRRGGPTKLGEFLRFLETGTDG